MNSYGEVVRKIRINKGLSQKEVYLNIISKSYAIEFEKGNHDISLKLFEQILDRLIMDIDEFFYIYRGYKPSKHQEFLNSYGKAVNNNNVEALIKLYHEVYQNKDQSSKVQLAELRSRIRLSKHFNSTFEFDKKVVMAEDIETVSNYLNHLQSWTLQEMQMFTNSLDYIDNEMRDILYQTLIKSMKKYEDYDRGREVICAMLTNMIYELIRTNKINYAEVLLEDLKKISVSYQMLFFKIIYKYYNGLIKIKKNNKEEGTELSQSAIDVLYEFDHPHQAKILESILSQVLE